MNKKIIQIMLAILLAILLAFALSGCGKGKVQTGEMISILNWKRINRAAMI